MYSNKIPDWALLLVIVAAGFVFFGLSYYPDHSVLEGICGLTFSEICLFGEWVHSREERRSRTKGNNFGLV